MACINFTIKSTRASQWFRAPGYRRMYELHDLITNPELLVNMRFIKSANLAVPLPPHTHTT
jgi:hypothetical protein